MGRSDAGDARPRDSARYGRRASRYLANAKKMLLEREVDKAAELVWGAFALLVKSSAARRRVALRGHAALRAFANEMAADLAERYGADVGGRFIDDFGVAEHLHSGFYEGEINPVAVARLAQRQELWRQRIRRLLAR
ncbi:MAG: hypothetical protein A3K65_09570 [Euryarchaeota archaeon RBG_16_68_12]|nr:MAG: hypothetical protein A3K65_09570 [Euryarchaeota archaeon RBG_16_68_12]